MHRHTTHRHTITWSEDSRCRPDAVISRIEELEASGRQWSLHAADIRELLGVSPEEFYRRIYIAQEREHPLISLSAATATYSQENIWEFVALVELFCGGWTESRLERAGIFFTHAEQLEILGTFLSEAAAAVRTHPLDSGQFSAMLETFGSYERARDVYLEEYFPLGGLIDRAAAAYCRDHSFEIPGLAEENVKRLLRFFFQKHVLEVRSVFAAVIEQLLQLRAAWRPRQAEAEGYAAFQEERRQGGGASEEEAGRLVMQEARKAMELGDRALSLPLLKSQYKRLMKIYHPDINPRGLRRCQEITAAYSLLASSL
jgi:hypothetical protein